MREATAACWQRKTSDSACGVSDAASLIRRRAGPRALVCGAEQQLFRVPHHGLRVPVAGLMPEKKVERLE